MRSFIILTLLASLAATSPAEADVALPAIFGDGMVLQRRAPLPVWGTAAPGEAVTVTLDKQSKQTTAGADGKWRVTLDPIEAGGPMELTVIGNNTVAFKDVLGGEVWLCGGQSNMEWQLQNAKNGQAEVAAADYPQMRIFDVQKATAGTPAADVTAKWQIVTPQTAGSFSAVGYFFGRDVQKEISVPIGLIGSYWGGTRIEPWMTPDSLAAAGFGERAESAAARIKSGNFRKTPTRASDTGNAKPGWAKADLDESGWGNAPVPGPFLTDQLDLNGVAWYRRHVTVPADVAGQPMTLRLGPVDDGDITYFNGVEIAKTEAGNGSWDKPRVYDVPGELVRAGDNVIAVRVFDQIGPGGFKGEAGAMMLTPTPNGGKPIPLAGTWKVAVEKLVAPDHDAADSADLPDPQSTPTMLYNGMVAPLAPYAVRGFTWYQGESNADEAQDYAALLRGLIAGWRGAFAGPTDEKQQPFLIVQLANFQQRSDDPNAGAGWADLREAQAEVSRDPGNGMAVILDVGEAGDIHPRDKQTVGDRLARVALRDVYGKSDVMAQGPTLKSAKASGGGKVTLQFNDAKGLTLTGDAAQAFAVCGADGKFAWATPAVKGDAVELSFSGVGTPTVVRYGWQMNPPAPLCNAAGLPAVPFEVKVGQ